MMVEIIFCIEERGKMEKIKNYLVLLKKQSRINISLKRNNEKPLITVGK
jgi:hypothetical protein